MYAYGCSLGAQLLGLYLRKEGANACKFLDGTILYGTPWSSKKGADQLDSLYVKAIGLVLSETIRKE